MQRSNIKVKFDRAIADPARIPHYLRSNLSSNFRFLKRGKFLKLLGAFTGGIFGWNVYIAYLKYKNPDGEIVKRIHENDMILDLEDTGISRDLIMFETREYRSTEILREEIQLLADSVDGPVTVLELGANVGYYALQEADILEDKSNIYAFEPSPANFNRLKRNVEINRYEERVEPINAAIGSENGTAHLEIQSQSNLHRVVQDGSERSVEVPLMTVEAFLENRSIPLSDVNLIRMDVQGFELEIFKGMGSLLEESVQLLLFVEFHPGLDERELSELTERLRSNDFEIISSMTANGVQTWYEYPSTVATFSDLFGIDNSVEVIMKKQTQFSGNTGNVRDSHDSH